MTGGARRHNTLCRWALLQLPHLVSQTATAPSLCTVFFGANDAAVPASKQHVPIEEYQVNLEALVALLRQAWPACLLVIVTPPPVDQEVWDAGRGGPGGGMRQLELTRLYAEAACKVAASAGCECIDFFKVIHARDDWKECLSDGLHLATPGNQVLYDCVCELIAKRIPALKPHEAPVHFPLWGDMADAEAPKTLIPRFSHYLESENKSCPPTDKKRKL